MTPRWLLLQLADGTFPSGGFAHSGGLEAIAVLGGLASVEAFADAYLRQLGSASLPFVRAAAEDPRTLAELDDACDATLPLGPPNRASRAMGRALASAAARVWEAAQPIATYAEDGPAHHPPVFGAIHGTLGLGVDETLAGYLHGALRGVMSAAVRLGLVGTLEAQRLVAERAALLDEVMEGARGALPKDAAQTAPLLEMYAALHERLDGRMFQS